MSSETPRQRPRGRSLETAPPPTTQPAVTETSGSPTKPVERRPFLLDFYPLQTVDQTRLAAFYDRLKEGRFSTTRCSKDGEIHWPPRVACPRCHSEELEWVDLPNSGRLYAFSAVLAGAPLGMETDTPFAVGLVEFEGVPFRIFGRIEGAPWSELSIGQRVAVEPFALSDGRAFYRFRAVR